tara:strand:- start:663 stop:1160 length:498 start_codon:yes stop_codon:yes gene_type:complete
MAILVKNFKSNISGIVPLFLLLFISFNGMSIIDLNFFSVNIHFILVYYFVLRKPDLLGNGFIFLSGIITDVVHGLPIGTTAITLLIVAGVASYVRVVTVRISLLTDWISFIPTLLLASFSYYLVLSFSDYSINYIYLLKNSIFTLIFYPILWFLFSILLNLLGEN